MQKAQWERLDEELKGIAWEIIPVDSPVSALELIRGRYVVFMESDSAFESGSLRNALSAFEDNPSYRKLAMVSPAVDFDNYPDRISFFYDNGLGIAEIGDSEEGNSPVSIGYFFGSVIRVTALKKIIDKLNFKKDPISKSVQISDVFWSNGQRVELCADATYYASPAFPLPDLDDMLHNDNYRIKAKAESLKVWNKEFIL